MVDNRLPHLRCGLSAALALRQQLEGVEHGDIIHLVHVHKIFGNPAELVHTKEQLLLKVGIVAVGGMVDIVAAATKPVSWKWRQQKLFELGSHAQEWEADFEELQ